MASNNAALYAIDRKLGQLRLLTGLTEAGAEKAAKAVEREINRTLKAGQAPDGTPWKPKQDRRAVKRVRERRGKSNQHYIIVRLRSPDRAASLRLRTRRRQAGDSYRARLPWSRRSTRPFARLRRRFSVPDASRVAAASRCRASPLHERGATCAFVWVASAGARVTGPRIVAVPGDELRHVRNERSAHPRSWAEPARAPRTSLSCSTSSPTAGPADAENERVQTSLCGCCWMRDPRRRARGRAAPAVRVRRVAHGS